MLPQNCPVPIDPTACVRRPSQQKDEKASRDGFPILSKVRALLQLLGSSVAQHDEAECLVSSIVSKSFFAAAAAVRAALVISWPPRRSLCSRSPHVKSSKSCLCHSQSQRCSNHAPGFIFTLFLGAGPESCRAFIGGGRPQGCPTELWSQRSGVEDLGASRLWAPLRSGQNLFGPLLGVHARMSISGYTRGSYFRDLVKAS